MDTLPLCFVKDVVVPVRVISSGDKAAAEENTSAEVHQFSTLQQVKSHFSRTAYPYNFVSICQRHSWRPLEVTRPMFSFLTESFDLKSSAWNVASCFYDKDSDVESTYCAPFTIHYDGPTTEVSYTIRYPEYKESQETWVIRQTGIYQKFNAKTSHNLFILFNPAPSTKLHQHVQLLASKGSPNAQQDFFWLHKSLFSTYFSAWRSYNAHLETALIPIASNAVATFIDELSEAEYHHVTELAFLETRLVQVPTILAASEDVLEALCCLCSDMSLDSAEDPKNSAKSALRDFQQYIREGKGYIRVAECLQERAQKITQLLANTLSFREQLNAKSQNDSMLKLNKSAVFITILTLFYLPPSFMATFFGMNFFDLDENSHQIIVTRMIWIYFLCSVALTVVTFVLYHLILDGTLLSRLARRAASIKIYGRMRSLNPGSEVGVELV